MKNISRCNSNHLDVNIYAPKPKTITIQSTFHAPFGKNHLCLFSLGDNLLAEIPAPSCLWNYKITWRTSKSCYIRFYDAIYDATNQTLQYLSNIDDRYCRYIGNGATFTASFKKLAIITSKPVFLTLTLTPTPKIQTNIDYLDFLPKKGHNRCRVKPEYIDERKNILAYSERHSRARQLPAFSGLLPAPFDVGSNLSYYFNINSILTITTRCDSNLAYAPYSIRCIESADLIAVCEFDIEIKPCAGDDAEVTVSAIESLSNDSYRVLKDHGGTSLILNFVGKRLKGVFRCPVGCPDIGLHIYTPYGFGDDSRDNCYKKLAIFHNFFISYVRI